MRVKKILFSLIFALLGIMCVTGSVFLLQGCSQSTPKNGEEGISENPESEDPDDPNDKPTEMQSHIESTLTKYVQNTSGQYLEATGGGSATIVYDFVLDGYDSTDWDIPGITLGLNDSSASGKCTTNGDPWTNRWRSKITATAAEHFSFFKYDGKYSNGSDWVSVTKTDNPYIQDDIITTNSGIWGTSYINLNVLFSRNKYTVYFDPNGGSGSISLSYVYYQASVGTLPTVGRNGYSFTGWYTAASGGTQISSSTTITKSVTYYAHWSANTYKVTLNANGGSGGTSAVWFKYGTNTYYSNSSCTTAITSITKPTRTGYTYDTSKGFYLEKAVDGASDGERYIAYESMTFASDLCTDIYSNVTLICNWTINTYRLSINYYSSATNRSQLTTTATTCNVADETLSAPTTNSSYTFTYITHTYTTAAQTITFKLNSAGSYSYYLKIGSAPTTTSYNKLFTSAADTYTYSWRPNANLTINLYVYQRYTISYKANNGSGTVPSTQYKIHGTSVSLTSNRLTRTSYLANGWNTTASGTGTAYIETALNWNYSVESSVLLYADWTPIMSTINIKIMTSTNGSSFTNSVTGGTATLEYYYDSLNNPKKIDPAKKISSASDTTQVLSQQTVTIRGIANSGYRFVGITSSSTTPPYSSYVGSLTPSGNSSYTRYIYFVKDTNNTLKYDSTDKYFYFEDGYFPQSYVGDALNATLNSATLDRNLKYLDASGSTVSIPIYTYSGEKYAKVQKNNVTKWFKVEKIRWRVSEYGVSSSGYASKWAYGKLNTNFKVVSDRVLWIGAITRANTKEGWSFDSSNMRTYFSEIYKKNGASVSDEKPTFETSYNEKSYYYGPAGQQEKVKYTTSSYSGINIATEEEIKENLTDLRARASDMVAFILGLNEDSYCDYWTRELGGSLKNGKMITNSGITKSAWLQNFYGVRFSLRMSEGSRV